VFNLTLVQARATNKIYLSEFRNSASNSPSRTTGSVSELQLCVAAVQPPEVCALSLAGPKAA
jgi:hypothetical protein